MKREGEIHGVPVMSSKFVDKDSIYLINPGTFSVLGKIWAFKPMTRRMKIKWYFRNLRKAICGKAV